MKGAKCANSFLETDLLLPKSREIESNRIQVVETTTQLPKYLKGGSLDFFIEPNAVENISLIESFLHLKFRVIKYENGTEKNLEDKDAVSVVPFIANSLFKGVSLWIGDEQVTLSLEQYQQFEGYVNSLLHLSQEEQKRYLDGAALFLSPPDGHGMTNPAPDLVTKTILNPGLSERHTLVANSSLASVTSPILWPLFLVPKILPTNVEIKLSLALSSPEFCLIAHPYPQPTDAEGAAVGVAPPLPTYGVKIETAQIYLTKYRLSQEALAHQERILATSGALYPMTANHTISFNVPKDTKEHSRHIVLGNRLPKMIYIFQTERDKVENISASPFNFIHSDIEEIYLDVDGQKYPCGQSYTPNFPSGDFYKDYRLFQRELNYSNSNMCFDLHGWDSGFTIFAFNLVPDRSVDCPYISVPRQPTGTVTLHIKYRKGLEQANTVFVMMEHDKILAIDQNRKPHWKSADY